MLNSSLRVLIRVTQKNSITFVVLYKISSRRALQSALTLGRKVWGLTTKNIPTPSEELFIEMLLQKTNEFIRVRWKIYSYDGTKGKIRSHHEDL